MCTKHVKVVNNHHRVKKKKRTTGKKKKKAIPEKKKNITFVSKKKKKNERLHCLRAVHAKSSQLLLLLALRDFFFKFCDFSGPFVLLETANNLRNDAIFDRGSVNLQHILKYAQGGLPIMCADRV